LEGEGLHGPRTGVRPAANHVDLIERHPTPRKVEPMTPHRHWIMTSDERCAILFLCQRVPPGHWHIEQRKSLENRWEHYHEAHRPSALGRGPSANAAQHFASLGHEVEEEHRRFAREVSDWLTHAITEFGVEHISIFAASRFLGLLRQELGDLGTQADLLEGELTRLRPSELSIHPAVVNALESHAGTHQPRR
jgi:protein required for attachment to host cells